PLLTLLKQARSFGLGVVLATQNPVDLDYKGLSNAGTWFVGRLQTDRDKERMLDGLEGAGTGEGRPFDRARMGRIIGGLGKRVFLMNNVHEQEPVVFHTRWAMSYLPGPLTREQIRRLMDPRKAASRPAAAQAGPAPARREAPEPVSAGGAARPILPPDIDQFFVPLRAAAGEGGGLIYLPMPIGLANLYYADAKTGVTVRKAFTLLGGFSGLASGDVWGEAAEVEIASDDLERFPDDDVPVFGDLPDEAAAGKSYAAWGRALAEKLYREQRLTLLRSPSLKETSAPGETERDFRIRLQLKAHEKRDALVERVRKKYAGKIAAMEDRIMRARQAVERESVQARQQKLQTAVSFGTTVLGALLGRKAVSASTLGRASTTASRAGRILKESRDVGRARESLQELEARLAELHSSLAAEVEALRSEIDPTTEELETIEIRPRKKDISIGAVGLAWVPHRRGAEGGVDPAW
ncbi:MAG: ATP-binding protein, partial [Candidatus Krumholzibacteria bacterium]|nr:ATP-binding protein [Candidatus Krumholzibacteria bacterium]